MQIDSVVPGSVRVSARIAFLPASSGLVAGYSCALGATTPCGALVTILASSPGALFATSSLFAGIPVTVVGINVALRGNIITVSTPPPASAAVSLPGAVQSSSSSLLHGVMVSGFRGLLAISSVFVCIFLL